MLSETARRKGVDMEQTGLTLDEYRALQELLWRRSLATYRAGVDAFAHALRIRVATGHQLVGTRAEVPLDAIGSSRPPRREETVGKVAPLSGRESEVAALVAQGFTNRQIAETLIISRGTAANHVAHVLDKLGLDTRTQLAVWHLQHRRSDEEQSSAASTDVCRTVAV